MGRQRLIAVLIVGGLVAACNSPASPPPSTGPVAQASVSAAPLGSPAPSPSPSSAPSPSIAPTATPSFTPTVAPTPVPTPVPWKTFTSKRYHYKMQYPPDWIVTPGAAGVADQFDHFGPPVVFVSRDTVNGTASLSLTVSRAISLTKSHYKAKLSSNTSIKLAGWKGRLLKFTGSDEGRKLVILEIVLAKGSVVYFIDEIGDLKTFTADRALFKKMYLTWRPR